MLWITIIAVITALFFLTRFYFLKREIRRAAKQLDQFNSRFTAKKIDITYMDKDIEHLAMLINKQIDLTQQANAEKQRTENELKQAISNISHDIRTPMTSILGYVQFLEEVDLTPEKRIEYTAIVRNGALRLKVLLEDFFELSIIESADFPLKVESIALNGLVSEVLVGFYEEFNKRGIEPAILVPKHEIRILADPSAVKRVIENLVVNSIRHSSGNVSVELARTQSSVQLFIRNPSHPLSEKDLIHLFDRFYKADSTRKGKGTGLGLSIAKSLMLRMDGNLSAELIKNELVMKCEWEI